MKRILEPELLDALPATDPRALQCRRDLRRINWWMRNPAMLASIFKEQFPQPPQRIADLGAGDGDFSLQLMRHLPSNWTGIEIVLVDQKNASAHNSAAFAERGWKPVFVVADVFDWLNEDREFDCIYANLFLHHFSDEQLRILFEGVSRRTKFFVGCEPRRYRFSFLIRLAMFVIGCNEVTRKDGVISVRAGFRKPELSTLWRNDGWLVDERRGGIFSHIIEARRNS